MALIKCTECGTEISDQAKICVKCGAPAPTPKKKTSFLTWTVAAIMAVGIISALKAKNDAVSNAPPPVAIMPEQIAKEKLAELDRMNAGALVLTIKKSLRDPDSFKLHNAFVTAAGAACIEYSGINGFNARTRGMAVVSRDKKTIATSTDNASINAWNRLCANKTGDDYTALFQKTLLE